MNYKFICSCVRNFDKINIDVVWENLFEENHNPKPGDLMLVEVLDDTCGYDSVEDSYGRLVKLYDGDVFVAVLGNRMSGTNLVGSVPSHPLKRNDTIHLLAQGGIVGEILGVNNGHRGGKAMPLRVVGFLTDGERILNTVYEAEKKITNRNPAVHNKTIQKYFVMGTSAEVGKTTLVSRLIREIKETVPQKKIAVIKVCGTGRLKDKNQYKDAGSDFAYDFVDFGYPSTYAISPVEYMKLFDEMLFVVEQLADIIIVELLHYYYYHCYIVLLLNINIILMIIL